MSPLGSVFEVLGLDAALDNGKRLAILTALESPYAEEGLTYMEVVGLTGVTYGNLPPHARILEDAGFLASRRETGTGPKKRTSYRITPEGRRTLEAHYYALLRLRTELGLRVRDLKSPVSPHRTARRDRGEPIGEALP